MSASKSKRLDGWVAVWKMHRVECIERQGRRPIRGLRGIVTSDVTRTSVAIRNGTVHRRGDSDAC